MSTIAQLDKLVLSGVPLTWFQQEVDEEIAKQVRDVFNQFVDEFCLELIFRRAPGYYIPYNKERKIGGIHPLSFREFYFFVAYSCCIIFNEPLVELTKDFIRKLAYCYSLDMDEAEAFISYL